MTGSDFDKAVRRLHRRFEDNRRRLSQASPGAYQRFQNEWLEGQPWMNGLIIGASGHAANQARALSDLDWQVEKGFPFPIRVGAIISEYPSERVMAAKRFYKGICRWVKKPGVQNPPPGTPADELIDFLLEGKDIEEYIAQAPTWCEQNGVPFRWGHPDPGQSKRLTDDENAENQATWQWMVDKGRFHIAFSGPCFRWLGRALREYFGEKSRVVSLPDGKRERRLFSCGPDKSLLSSGMLFGHHPNTPAGGASAFASLQGHEAVDKLYDLMRTWPWREGEVRGSRMAMMAVGPSRHPDDAGLHLRDSEIVPFAKPLRFPSSPELPDGADAQARHCGTRHFTLRVLAKWCETACVNALGTMPGIIADWVDSRYGRYERPWESRTSTTHTEVIHGETST